MGRANTSTGRVHYLRRKEPQDGRFREKRAGQQIEEMEEATESEIGGSARTHRKQKREAHCHRAGGRKML